LIAFKYLDRLDIAITYVIDLEDQNGKVNPLPLFKSIYLTGT
jgi:hypothetical protein